MRLKGKPLSNYAISLSATNHLAIPTSDIVYVTNLQTKSVNKIKLELRQRVPSDNVLSIQNLTYERIKKCLYCDIYLLILTTYGKLVLYDTALERDLCTVNDLLEDVGQIKEFTVLECVGVTFIVIGNESGKVAIFKFELGSQTLVSKCMFDAHENWIATTSTSNRTGNYISIATSNCQGAVTLWKYNIELNQVDLVDKLFETDYKICTAIEFGILGDTQLVAVAKADQIHIALVGQNHSFSKVLPICLISGLVWSLNRLRIYTLDARLYVLDIDPNDFALVSMSEETNSLRSQLSSSVDIGGDDASDAGSEVGIEEFSIYGVVSSQHNLIDFIVFEQSEPFSNTPRTEGTIAVHRAEYPFPSQCSMIELLQADLNSLKQRKLNTSPATILYDLYFCADRIDTLDINTIDSVISLLSNYSNDHPETLQISYYFLIVTERIWECTLMSDQYKNLISNLEVTLSLGVAISVMKQLPSHLSLETLDFEGLTLLTLELDMRILGNLVSQCSDPKLVKELKAKVPKKIFDSSADLINGKPQDEKCVICGGSIEFSVFGDAHCVNGHYFARCAVSKTIIDFPNNYNCSTCPAKLRNFERKTALTKLLPTVKCLYCQSPYIKSKIEFT
ncbi:hypothetical protein HDV06_003078 [Boothiomyces sp. JEL0866]|nr:hypothetical protein HDV06_000522 [Boothiomyces sp. JEL0866]KAJ3322358.1 hypothetical protein HDV06_003078 [Boothiomyces sp. JEL0866]